MLHFIHNPIRQYAASILTMGVGWLILPIVWIQRHRFENIRLKSKYWIAGCLIPIWLSLAVVGYNGFLSDYNPEWSKFIHRETVAPILQSSPVSLVNLSGKTGVLINFYTKNIVRVNSLLQVSPNNYAWIESSRISKAPESSLHRLIGTVKEYSLVQVLPK